MTIVQRRDGRAVGLAGGALVVASLLGGAASVFAGVNTWADAWTASATLAAPWPMLVVQAAATAAAARGSRRVARTGSAVLALAAGLSGISGFFDGQLARTDLGVGYVAAQIAFVVVAWVATVVAAIHCWRLRPSRVRDADSATLG